MQADTVMIDASVFVPHILTAFARGQRAGAHPPLATLGRPRSDGGGGPSRSVGLLDADRDPRGVRRIRRERRAGRAAETEMARASRRPSTAYGEDSSSGTPSTHRSSPSACRTTSRLIRRRLGAASPPRNIRDRRMVSLVGPELLQPPGLAPTAETAADRRDIVILKASTMGSRGWPGRRLPRRFTSRRTRKTTGGAGCIASCSGHPGWTVQHPPAGGHFRSRPRGTPGHCHRRGISNARPRRAPGASRHRERVHVHRRIVATQRARGAEGGMRGVSSLPGVRAACSAVRSTSICCPHG